jgi:hypothetical protein
MHILLYKEMFMNDKCNANESMYDGLFTTHCFPFNLKIHIYFFISVQLYYEHNALKI